MQAPKIKFTQRLALPIIRKRDGQEATHCIRMNLTTDEALLLCDLFSQFKEEDDSAPTFSLLRVAMGMVADKTVNEETLVSDMAKWRLRESLAAVLTTSDFNRALTYLETRLQAKLDAVAKSAKAPKEIFTEPAKKERREYVFTPEPRKK